MTFHDVDANICLPAVSEESNFPPYGNQETYSPVSKTQKYSLEKRLFHALHAQKINTPTIKEFQESWAFANSARTYYCKKSSLSLPAEIEVVIDVAGGHGALGALFLLLLKSVKRSIVIDPAVVEAGKRGIRNAWFGGVDTSSNTEKNKNGKVLEYQHESLFSALPSVLHELLHKQKVQSTKVLVVACHACQHLSDETLRISEQYGVHVAVMPCCQKDHSGSWKAAAKNMGISLKKINTHDGSKLNSAGAGEVGVIMDLLSAGKMMGENAGLKACVRYEVKMKVIDPKITPQNRLIMCRAVRRKEEERILLEEHVNNKNLHQVNENFSQEIKEADEKLQRAYHRAHKKKKGKQRRKKEKYLKSSPSFLIDRMNSLLFSQSTFVGFGLGIFFSSLILHKKSKIIK